MTLDVTKEFYMKSPYENLNELPILLSCLSRVEKVWLKEIIIMEFEHTMFDS